MVFMQGFLKHCWMFWIWRSPESLKLTLEILLERDEEWEENVDDEVADAEEEEVSEDVREETKGKYESWGDSGPTTESWNEEDWETWTNNVQDGEEWDEGEDWEKEVTEEKLLWSLPSPNHDKSWGLQFFIWIFEFRKKKHEGWRMKT